MPLRGRWRSFTRTGLARAPEEEGVYELANGVQTIIYVGSSNNLRRRLTTHLIGGKMRAARYFRCEVCSPWDFESRLTKEAKNVQKVIDRTGKKPRRVKRTPRRDPLFDL